MSDGVGWSRNNNVHVSMAVDCRTQLLMTSAEVVLLFQWLPGKPGRLSFMEKERRGSADGRVQTALLRNAM